MQEGEPRTSDSVEDLLGHLFKTKMKKKKKKAFFQVLVFLAAIL